MKYIGEAVNKNINSLNAEKRLVLLGIANWTTVAKRESLILKDNCQQPVEYSLKDFKSQKGIKVERLDPNHTHFILGELPVVMVVLEGGPNTARAVIESVRKRIPCIFINRSGRISDIFSFIYESIEGRKKAADEGSKRSSEGDERKNVK